MTTVRAISRRTKEALATEIAQYLDISTPAVSVGASVDSRFLDTVYERRFAEISSGTDAYRKTELLLNRLRVDYPYDPYWDTSEARGATGGSTVTARAYSRILTALTGRPRCFLVPSTLLTGGGSQIDMSANPVGTAFADAGPGSLVIITTPDHAGGLAATRRGHVADMTPGWVAPWHIELDLVPCRLSIKADVALNRIIEIDFESYSVLIAGTEHPPRGRRRVSTLHSRADILPSSLERIPLDFPSEELSLPDFEPPARVAGRLPERSILLPTYAETRTGSYDQTGLLTGDPQWTSAPRSNRVTSRLIETRAISVASEALRRAGWHLIFDAQQSGEGYDLLYGKLDQRLKVEVKGIAGPKPIFNLTSKEWWRAQSDAEWILVAVTNALSPAAPKITTFPREDILQSNRVITGYRVNMDRG